MLDFVFKNFQRIPDLTTRAWQTQHAEERAKQFDKTRIQILDEAAAGKCVCAGCWKTAALELLAANDISHSNGQRLFELFSVFSSTFRTAYGFFPSARFLFGLRVF